MSAPRVTLAAPIFNQAEHLEEALASLRDQSYADFALVLVDDGSTDGTVEIARRHAAADTRVRLYVNSRRLGMLENTNRAWALAQAQFPDSEFRALASDHDVWDKDWLAALVGALDGRPSAVLAYPWTQRIDGRGELLPYARRSRCETVGISRPFRRLKRAYRCMVAGDMIYGLLRGEMLGGRPFYEPLLVPDRLLLSELALRGEFCQVPRTLWYRRFEGLSDLERQRRAFWLERPPRYARLPWWVVHAGYAWAKPDASGRSRRRLAATLLVEGAALRVRRRLQALRRRVGRRLKPPTRAAMIRAPWLRRVLTSARLPVSSRIRDLLRRLAQEAETASR